MPVPACKLDFYSKKTLRDPNPCYRRMRDLGPTVWLPKHNLYAVSRFAEVTEVLHKSDTFLSGRGVAANDYINERVRHNTLLSDGHEHRRLKNVVKKPLTPQALGTLKTRIQSTADDLIHNLRQRGSFDGVMDLASHLPLTIVKDMVGLPEKGRENMLKWAAAGFNIMGPMNLRAVKSLPMVKEAQGYLASLQREHLVDGGWARRLYESVDAGHVTESDLPGMFMDYMGPSLDTTILATAHLVHLLGTHPDQWQMLKTDPSLVPQAVNEGVRLATPLRGWTRYVERDYPIGDHELPAGSRVLVVLASANRDERRWQEPDTFDVSRDTSGHVGFGHGTHICVGMHLARLEMQALLNAMLEQVDSLEVGEGTLAYNNVLRGFATLPVKFA